MPRKAKVLLEYEGYKITGAIFGKLRKYAGSEHDTWRFVLRLVQAKPDNLWTYLQHGIRTRWLFEPCSLEAENPMYVESFIQMAELRCRKEKEKKEIVRVRCKNPVSIIDIVKGLVG